VSGPARKVSSKGTLRVYLSCSAVCTTRTQVTVPLGRRKIRSLMVSKALQPELRSSVRVKFTKYGLRQIRQAFRKRTRLKAEVSARASVAGIDKSASTRLQIRLQR
jgi:hypothetical protein